MLLIVLAGLNAFWFKLKIHPLTLNNPGQADANNTAKLVAALSLLLWFGVIVMGRMIPYLEE